MQNVVGVGVYLRAKRWTLHILTIFILHKPVESTRSVYNCVTLCGNYSFNLESVNLFNLTTFVFVGLTLSHHTLEHPWLVCMFGKVLF